MLIEASEGRGNMGTWKLSRCGNWDCTGRSEIDLTRSLDRNRDCLSRCTDRQFSYVFWSLLPILPSWRMSHSGTLSWNETQNGNRILSAQELS